MSFSVTLDTYRGPLDLLLFLVRKHEVEITDIPIALITQQYLDYLTVLEVLDVDAVGDFLELASILVEIKSRQVLPQADEDQAPLDDPRGQLVEQLLEYKKYKDAASVLEERSRQWQSRYARLADDLPPRRVDPADRPIQEMELWDLVSAFGRIMRDSRAAQPASIVYDDTPIHVHMERIHQRLVAQGRVAFSEMFEPGMPKAALIGVFLALLELVRHHSVHTHQEQEQGEIWISPGSRFAAPLDLSEVDEYGSAPVPEPNRPAQPR
ncbi:MAG: segregation/condensation protein A [Pirellulaceae bacterium]|jgi:segregation and condensation protein A|nr:segregation/condensation protein A [Pirellulaceae bacterium]